MKIRKFFVAPVALVIAFSLTPAYAAQADNLATMQQFLGVMKGYYGIIEATYEVARDPDKSAILQMQKIEEFYKKRGDRAEAIAVLEDVLNRTKRPAVRNAAAVMLADALNETGRGTRAVEVLKQALEENLK